MKTALPRVYQKRDFIVEEFRVDTEESGTFLRGHAAVFNKEADIGWFKEIVRPGAFADTIVRDDIRALWNHDPNFVLGRKKNGTLRLSEDSIGLSVEIHPPDSPWAACVVESVRRKDVDQMSIGFISLDEQWGKKDGVRLREILKIQLFDVSPVTFPAFVDTDVSVRSCLASIGINYQSLFSGLMKAECGEETLRPEELEAVTRAHEILKTHFTEIEIQKAPRIDNLRRRLELA